MDSANSAKLLFDGRALRKLIVPLIIEQTLALSVGAFDTLMISSLGEAAVSGVSLVDMISALIINLFAALGTGGAVVASQYLGAKREKNARESATNLLGVTLLISLVMMGLCLLLNHQLLRLFFGKIEADVMSAARTYFYITTLSYPFIAIYNCCAALFRAMGNSGVSMRSSLISNLLNIGGNALLIYGAKIGVAGAAWATVFARFVAMVILLCLLTRRKYVIHINLKEKLRFQPSLVKRILYIGIPSGVENSLFSLGRIVVVSMISAFGTTQITANSVANTLQGIGCIAGNAMGLAMITVVGQSVGAGDEKQLRYYVRKLMKITYLLHAAVNLLLMAALPIVLPFYHLSDSTYRLTMILVIVHSAVGIFLWPLSFTFPNALRAANDVKFTMSVSIFSMFCFRITLSMILCTMLGWGAIGVWIAMIVDWCVRCTCFIIRYLSGAWKKHSGLLPVQS